MTSQICVLHLKFHIVERPLKMGCLFVLPTVLRQPMPLLPPYYFLVFFISRDIGPILIFLNNELSAYNHALLSKTVVLYI